MPAGPPPAGFARRPRHLHRLAPSGRRFRSRPPPAGPPACLPDLAPIDLADSTGGPSGGPLPQSVPTGRPVYLTGLAPKGNRVLGVASAPHMHHSCTAVPLLRPRN